SKFVVLKVRFRWRAAGPFEGEDFRLGKNICTVVADTEWKIAHKKNPTFFGVELDCAPLLRCDPLDVTKELRASFKAGSFFRGKLLQPTSSAGRATMFFFPTVPRFTLPILFHESAE